MTSQEITALIDTVWEGVDKSKAGPLHTKNEEGHIVWNALAFEAFRGIIGCLVPRPEYMTTVKMDEPKEPWEG